MIPLKIPFYFPYKLINPTVFFILFINVWTGFLIAWFFTLCIAYSVSTIVKTPYLNINPETITYIDTIVIDLLNATTTLYQENPILRKTIILILLLETIVFYFYDMYKQYRFYEDEDEDDFDEIRQYDYFTIRRNDHVLNIVNEQTTEYYVDGARVIMDTDYDYIRLKIIAPFRKKIVSQCRNSFYKRV